MKCLGESISSYSYNLKMNANSSFYVATMRRVPSIFFELEVIKMFMQIF